MVAPSIRTSLIDVTDVYNGPCRYLFKLELQQPSGSFKLRGMSFLVQESIQNAKATGKLNIHVYTSSGGNAGIAAAFAAKFHGIKCTVVLPQSVKKASLEQLTILGAKTIVYGEHWGAADEYLRTVVMPQTSVLESQIYCHPFDNELLWTGNGGMVDELSDQLATLGIDPEKVRGIVCSCGGGSLYNGLVAGLHRNRSLANVPVLVLETNQTASFAAAVKADKVVTLPKIETLTNSLGSPFVAEQTLANYKSHPTIVRLLDDTDAVKGALDYYDQYGAMVEPSCGVTIAVASRQQQLLQEFGPLKSDDVIIFIVCGGTGISEEVLQGYRQIVA